MNNDSLKTISGVLSGAERILLFPHINMDGDALGSAAALCHVLRRMGREAFVLLEDKIPDNLAFLDRGYCTFDADRIGEPDLCVCVDCGDAGRFPKRREAFMRGKTTMCIDHHATSDPFCRYNLIDPGACATGELIYKVICAMGQEIDRETGEALFAAITTDSGNFQYSNTTKETHEIVASLYDSGLDANGVSVKIYETVRLEKLKIRAHVLENITLYGGGRLCIGFVTQEMLKETGALMEETEGVVAELRSIDGVQIAVFIKEEEERLCKVSLRAKSVGDVAEIAAAFNGGGHKKAAGCTLHCTLREAEEKMRAAALENLERYDK